jgi:anaerobic ribonucleoside-triphosphate reductase activating protein
LLPFLAKFRQIFKHTKDIWAWTGFTWEELQQETRDKQEMLRYLDVLVDGPFKLALKRPNLQFRGSLNQRIISVQKSLKEGKIIIWENLADGIESYEQIQKAKLI